MLMSLSSTYSTLYKNEKSQTACSYRYYNTASVLTKHKDINASFWQIVEVPLIIVKFKCE